MPVVAGAALPFAQLPGRESADPLAGLTQEGISEVSVRVVRIPGDATRTAHRHPHSLEVVYVVSGEGTAWEDGVTTPVGPGDVLVVAAGVPHATIPRGAEGLVLVCFFPHGDLAANLEELPAAIDG